jgi:hypothetical protein
MRERGGRLAGAGRSRSVWISLPLGPALILLLLGFPAVRSQAFPPTVVLGLYGTDVLASAADAPAANEAGLGAGAAVDWKVVFPDGGSLAVAGSSGWVFAPGVTYDEETLALEAWLPVGGLRVELVTGLAASALGTQDELSPYLEPSWSVAARWLGDRSPVRPFAEAPGYARVRPGDDEDALYQGGALGLELVPSFAATYRVAIEGGWERWPEQAVDGAPREDLLVLARGGGEWLLGYFAKGELSAQAGYRDSDEATESRWFARADGALSWSPRRQLNLEGRAFLYGQWYTARALPSPLTGEVSVLKAGFDLGLDWTPDDRWYLVFGASVARGFSDDPQERGWTMKLRAGLELGF